AGGRSTETPYGHLSGRSPTPVTLVRNQQQTPGSPRRLDQPRTKKKKGRSHGNTLPASPPARQPASPPDDVTDRADRHPHEALVAASTLTQPRTNATGRRFLKYGWRGRRD